MPTSPALRFVHCADLHLDSPFRGLAALAPEVAEVLREASFAAFERVIDLALAESAAFLVVAGDVYDSADRSLRAQLRFRQALARGAAGGVECFVAHGNHDPLSGWQADLELPAGVHRFGPRVQAARLARGADEVLICGVSYPRREVTDNLARRFPRHRAAALTVAVLHTAVSGHSGEHAPYAPCTVDDLLAAGVDYWALGHVHAPAVLAGDGPVAVYAGTPQGRSPRETGARGCWVVDVERDGDRWRPRPRFAATDAVRWDAATIDAARCPGIDALLERLAAAVDGARRRACEPDGRARPAVLQLTVAGRGELHRALARVDPERDLAAPLRRRERDRDDFVWVDRVSLDTRPPLDRERLVRRRGAAAALIAAADAVRSAAEPAAAVRELLARRPEQRRVAAALGELGDAEVRAALERAESLGLDLLAVGEEPPS